MRRMAVVSAVCAIGAALPAPATAWVAPRYWPQVRHDNQLTNVNPAAADLAVPGVRWRMPMTAPPSQAEPIDANLDGVDDLLMVASGRLIVRSVTGKVLWQTAPLGIVAIADVTDFDGDGNPEVLGWSATAAYVVDGITGMVVWASPPGLFPAVQVCAAGSFVAAAPPQWAVAALGAPGGSMSAATHIYGFKGGKATELAVTASSASGVPFNFSYGQRHLDVDGDALADILVPGDKVLGVFSGKTGKPLAPPLELPAPLPQDWWPWALPADNGKPPLVALFAAGDDGPFGTQMVGFAVVQWKAGALTVVTSRWEPRPPSERYALAGSAIGDVDGDGQFEWIASRLSGGKWSLVAHDLPGGATLTVVDAFSTAPSGPAGGPVLRATTRGSSTWLLVSAETAAVPAPFGHITAATWSRAKGLTLHPEVALGAAAGLAGKCAASRAFGGPVLGADLIPPLRRLDGQDGADILPLLCDGDGDGRADRLVQFIPPEAKPIPGGVFELAGGTWLAGLWRAAPSPNGVRPWRLTGLEPDGRISVWDHTLALVNDGDGDGHSDVFHRVGVQPILAVAPWRDTDPAPAIIATVGNRVQVIDAAKASPTAAPKVTLALSPAPGAVRANLFDSDGDGTRELLVRYRPTGGAPTARAIRPDGQTAWTWQAGAMAVDWMLWWQDTALFGDFDGDGGEDALVALQPGVGSDKAPFFLNLLSGKAHAPVWSQAALCSWALQVPVAYDPGPPARFIASIGTDRYQCAPASGEALAKTTGKAGNGVPMVGPLDDQPGNDVAIGGGFFYLQAHAGAGLGSLWLAAETRAALQPSVLMAVDGTPVVAQQYGADATIEVRAGATGAPLWSRVLVAGKAVAPAQAGKAHIAAHGLVGVGDLTGKGDPALLAATADGWLYALHAKHGGLLWSADFGGTIGNPIPADVDGDGVVEVLVAVPSGELIALGGNLVAAPGWVRDHAAGGPALSEAEDIDIQEDSTTLRANWALVAGATGYLVRVVDDTGGEIVPQIKAGAATDLTIGDLYLHNGRTYRVAVSAVGAGAGASASAETFSDGVTIVDLGPPEWRDLACDPACTLPLDATMTARAVAVDKTALRRIGVDHETAGSLASVWSEQTTEAKRTVSWTHAYTTPGPHRVWFHAADAAGHVADAHLDVLVCAKGQSAVGNHCEDPKPALAPAQVIAIAGREVDACAAGRSHWGGARVAALALLAAVCAAVGSRRRRGEDRR